jgi:hypothetical protein
MSMLLEIDNNLVSRTYHFTTVTMISKFLVILLASILATPIAAIPHEISTYQTVHGSSTVSELTKRKIIYLSLWNNFLMEYRPGDSHQLELPVLGWRRQQGPSRRR